MKVKPSWNVRPSKLATNTINPIRSVVENICIEPNPDKKMIALSIGDPTVFGNLGPSNEAVDAVVDSIKCRKFNGYGPSVGFKETRQAIADHVTCPEAPANMQDVILTSGCSHALDLCISVLASPGDNILVPCPGFPLYKTLANGLGIKTKSYKLLPDESWKVDLNDLKNTIDDFTVAIIVNNPSNPCGSVFSKEHLKEIIEIAKENRIPIIADEIYDDFVFPGNKFYRMATLTKEVPILCCSGLTKRFMVPGWRTGWVIVYDRQEIFGDRIRKGLNSLSQRIIGCNTLVQGAIPTILNTTPSSYFENSIAIVQKNAELAYSLLCNVPGLKPVMPSGAMYMMIGIDMRGFLFFSSGLEFAEKMISEQSIFCLPGECFDIPGYIRIVLTIPEDLMREACMRIAEFCTTHYRDTISKTNMLMKDFYIEDISNTLNTNLKLTTTEIK